MTQDAIYTSISNILISVNPFKQLPLYTPQVPHNMITSVLK